MLLRLSELPIERVESFMHGVLNGPRRSEPAQNSVERATSPSSNE